MSVYVCCSALLLDNWTAKKVVGIYHLNPSLARGFLCLCFVSRASRLHLTRMGFFFLAKLHEVWKFCAAYKRGI